MNYNKNILNRIKQIRLKKNLSQYDLADKIFLSQPAYSKLESGTTALDIERLLLIVNALETDITVLLSQETNNSKKDGNIQKGGADQSDSPDEINLLNELERIQQQQQQQQQQLIAQQLEGIQKEISKEIMDLKKSILDLLL